MRDARTGNGTKSPYDRPDFRTESSGSHERMRRLVIVDGSAADAARWVEVLNERYRGRIVVETYAEALEALGRLGPDVDLLLVDLELPLFGGRKVLELAKERGVACRRIVVLSDRSAEELHALFPADSCLAVINKSEPAQQSAFLMILDSIIRKH